MRLACVTHVVLQSVTSSCRKLEVTFILCTPELLSSFTVGFVAVLGMTKTACPRPGDDVKLTAEHMDWQSYPQSVNSVVNDHALSMADARVGVTGGRDPERTRLTS